MAQVKALALKKGLPLNGSACLGFESSLFPLLDLTLIRAFAAIVLCNCDQRKAPTEKAMQICSRKHGHYFNGDKDISCH